LKRKRGSLWEGKRIGKKKMTAVIIPAGEKSHSSSPHYKKKGERRSEKEKTERKKGRRTGRAPSGGKRKTTPYS